MTCNNMTRLLSYDNLTPEEQEGRKKKVRGRAVEVLTSSFRIFDSTLKTCAVSRPL